METSMSDPSPLQDIFGDHADEELVFEEVETPTPAPPLPEPKAAKPRRLARRAESSLPSEDATEAAIPDVPDAPFSAPTDPVVAGEPAGADAPFPPRADLAGSTPSPWLIAVVGLALLSTMLSLGGLIAVGRALSRVDAERQEAANERDALARVPGLVVRMDEAGVKLEDAATRMAAVTPAGPPVTIADVRHELDALKLDLAQHQPQGVDALSGTTREGFAAMTLRLDRLSERLDRVAGASGGAISASRPASRAAYPKPTS
jgi:hypothetical protein